MAEKANSLSHTKWMYKYHIVFTPKYRRKVIYNQYRKTPRRFYRLTHDRNKIWYYTCIREQY